MDFIERNGLIISINSQSIDTQ